MSGAREALRGSVFACLTGILGGEHVRRTAAEQELKALEVTEEFGIVLAEIVVAVDSALEYRQLSSIVLKQYVQSHWSKLSDDFCEPMPSDQTKMIIRKLLPAGLRDTQSKIRATVAYAISAIARWDWPEEWPDLFDQLVLALGSGEPPLVHGAMRVLSEFCHEVSDHQLPHIAPVILPQLLRVIVQSEVYSARTRSRAVHIFNTIYTLIFAASGTYPEAIHTLLLPFLMEYLSAFVQLLSSSADANTDPGLRKEVIMCLCSLLRLLPKALHQQIMQIVTPIWNILVTSTPVYVSSVVNSLEPLHEVCDSDGEVVGQESTVFAIFEFISVLCESWKLKQLLPPILADLFYHLIAHMQITEDQVQNWLDDVNQFVEEDENEFSYSIRLSAHDLVMQLCEEDELSETCYTSLILAVEKHLQESPQQSSLNWWKVHEACLLACGSIVETAKAQKTSFNCQHFAENVVLPDLTAGASPLLTGRCLWLTGKMALLLSPETCTQLLEVVAQGLQPSQEPVLRVLAAKAVFSFCNELNTSEHIHLLLPWLPRILEHLAELAGDSPEDVTPLIVDALQLAAQMDKAVTAQCSHLVPIAMSLFLKYSHDPGISSCVEELFGVLANNHGCHSNLLLRFLPTAVEILESNESQLPLGLVSAALDVLVLIVRGCGSEGTGVPRELVTEVFPRIVQRVLVSSDDTAILQAGGECVRAFLAVAVEQLAAWVDPAGHNGLYYVVQVVIHLLDPSRPEFSASFVGKLIITFIKKAGHALGEHLELLLRSVLSKMQAVKSDSVMQSLLLVFAHLIQSEMEPVLSFLSQVPDPQGRPALDFVMIEWCARHPFFYGVYEMRVSTMALCKLLTHCLQTDDKRLTKIIVRGEEIKPNEGIQTRSQSAAVPQQWTQVPLPVKLLKLLVEDINNILESQAPPSQSGDSDSEDEYDEGEELGDVESIEALLAPASQFPGYDALEGEMGEGEDDPDLQDEPVLQVNLQAHLVQYLTELSQQPCFSSLSTLLSQREIETLRTITVQL